MKGKTFPHLNQIRPLIVFEWGSGGLRALVRTPNGEITKANLQHEGGVIDQSAALSFMQEVLKPYEGIDVRAEGIATSLFREGKVIVDWNEIQNQARVQFIEETPERELFLGALAHRNYGVTLDEIGEIDVHYGRKTIEIGVAAKGKEFEHCKSLDSDCRGNEDCLELVHNALAEVDPEFRHHTLTVMGGIMCEIGCMMNGRQKFKGFLMFDAEALKTALNKNIDDQSFLNGGKKASMEQIQEAGHTLIAWLDSLPNIKTVVISRATAREGLLHEMVGQEVMRVQQLMRRHGAAPV